MKGGGQLESSLRFRFQRWSWAPIEIGNSFRIGKIVTHV